MSRSTVSKKKAVRHAGELTHEQQIKRLVRQRNALWKFIDEHLIFGQSFDHTVDLDAVSEADIRGKATLDGEPFVIVDGDLWEEVTERFTEKRRDFLYQKLDGIVKSIYAMEGRNPSTGDDCRDVPEEVCSLYNVGSEAWR